MKNTGFALVSALFVVVILSLIGAYIVSISALTRSSTNLTMQGVKAYYAARSGLEWGTFMVTNGAGPYNCPTSPTTLNLTQGGLTGLTVTINCAANSYTEAGTTYKIFQLSAQGQYGAVGSAGYASRILYTTVVQPGV